MTTISPPDVNCLTAGEITESLEAVSTIRECYRVLEKGGLNIVGEILREQGPFYEMDHYPRDDVYDQEFGSQYYYHAHREGPEHGHFHLFLRDGALPPGLAPVAGPEGDERVAHIIAIAMDAWGYPTEFFAVNRWVTDESWFPAEDVIALLDRFRIDHAAPSWPVNQWLTAMVRCFRPHIAALLRHRDHVIGHRAGNDLAHVLEDRTVEVTGSLPLDLNIWQQQLLDARPSHEPADGIGLAEIQTS
jgi:hypothetical protein